jgi:dTDP-4-amino-4,6-dideoxygalactose transaminase
LTFIATVAAILFTGAKPVLVDIDPFTLNIDASKVNEAVTKHTKAIIPVHLYGKPADTETLTEIAQKNKLIIIEDAAQAHGAEVRGRRVGGLGQMGCFSFYPGKNIGAYGEGGAVTTDDEEFAEKIRLLRDWGAKKKYYYDVKGFSFRMETLQGAILQVKLRHLEKWTEARRRLARYYDEQLKDVSVQIPSTPVGVRHVYHVYAILTDDRDRLQDYLTAKAIQTNIHYPVPVHLQKAYSDMGYRTGDFPIAERACARLLSLPLYPEMTETQVEEVATAVRQGVEKLSKES